MSKRILLNTVASFLLALASAQVASAAPSACKGLEQTACAANGACVWRQALVAGETVTKAGTPAKRNVKAHCRKGKAPASTAQKSST
jgi:hypothetical protein